MADERGYELSGEILVYDGDAFFNVDKLGWARAQKYKVSTLKGHFNVGDQVYTEQNYVTDGETLTNSIDQLDINLKTVSDALNAYAGVKAVKVLLTLSDVSGLGTPVTVLAAPGANKAYQLIDIKWAVYPVVQLDVGAQNLELNFGSITNYLAIIRNDKIESATDYIKGVQVQAEHEIGINQALTCVLSGGANPVSGTATMAFWIIYKLIDV